MLEQTRYIWTLDSIEITWPCKTPWYINIRDLIIDKKIWYLMIRQKRHTTYPVLLNNWFNSSHLCMCKHPFEKPNNPSFIFLNGWQGAFRSPTSYNTWSCNEPPILILKLWKAITTQNSKGFYFLASKRLLTRILFEGSHKILTSKCPLRC